MIFLDVDQVLADWTGGVLDLLGLEAEPIYARWAERAPETWNIFDVPGFPVSASQAWREINRAGAGFWSALRPFPWTQDLLSACRIFGPTVLLTKPSRDPSSAMGKLAWMQAQFGGRSFEDYLIGPPKHALARPGALLIDDSPRNCAAFVEHGGAKLLFPSVGNHLRALRHDPLPSVLAKLRAHHGG